MTIRASIEPGNDLIGRFGDTVVLISRAGATEVSASELLQLVAELAADREAPSTAVATRLASWVLGHLSGDIAAFGIVAPVPDGVVVFLRGPVRCTVSAGDAVRQELTRHLMAADLDEGAVDSPRSVHEALHRHALGAARQAVLAMRANDEIGDDAFHRIEEELDWLEMSEG